MTDPRLENATYRDCKVFVPQFTTGKIVKCYDGDTVTIATIYNDELVRFSVRMLGYDTAEMRSKDETEKKCAHEAQEDIYTNINLSLTLILLKGELKINLYLCKCLTP